MNKDRTPAAELVGVTKRYRGSEPSSLALDSLDLSLRQGEVTSILGPNGAGKTTAVKLMLGLIRPTQGDVRLFGQNPGDASTRLRTGAMMQISSLPDTLRVEELVRLFSAYYPAPLRLDESLESAGLMDKRKALYGNLSGGQKQRVVFAIAICGNPDLLFLDEPTVGLDLETRQAFWLKIKQLIEAGKTIVLTTHYLEEADELSDRIVVIDQGKIVADGSPHAIKASTSSRKVSCVTTLRPADVLDHPAVQSARINRARLEIATSDGEAVVKHLLSLDPGLRNLEIVGAGIDEAFLHLTSGADGQLQNAAGAPN